MLFFSKTVTTVFNKEKLKFFKCKEIGSFFKNLILFKKNCINLNTDEGFLTFCLPTRFIAPEVIEKIKLPLISVRNKIVFVLYDEIPNIYRTEIKLFVSIASF